MGREASEESLILVAQPFQAVPKTLHRLESLCHRNTPLLSG